MSKEWPFDIGNVSRKPAQQDDVLLESAASKRRRKEIERQEEIDEAEHKAKMAELKKKKKVSDAEVEKADRRPESPEAIKVKGEFDLGHYSVADQLSEAKTEAKEAKQAMAQKLENETKAREAAEERAHKAEIEKVSVELSAKIDRLQEAIKEGVSPKSFAEQYEDIVNTAQKIGFGVPGIGGGGLGSSLEGLKIQQQMAREDRQFQRQMKQDERLWQLKIQEIQDTREYRRAELEEKARGREMWSKAPEMFGGVVGKAIMAGKSEGSGIAGKSQKQEYHFEAGWGQSGVAQCPNTDCGGEMAIGPTAKSAICVGCGLKVPIRRIGEKPAPKGKLEEESVPETAVESEEE